MTGTDRSIACRRRRLTCRSVLHELRQGHRSVRPFAQKGQHFPEAAADLLVEGRAADSVHIRDRALQLADDLVAGDDAFRLQPDHERPGEAGNEVFESRCTDHLNSLPASAAAATKLAFASSN